MIFGPWQYATGALILALTSALLWGARVDHLRAEHKSAHEQTKLAYKVEQENAQKKHDAEVQAYKQENRRLNDAADQRNDDFRIVYRNRVVRLPAAPAACVAGGGELPETAVSQGADRPGRDPVVLERADALICANNTARLQAVQQWAKDWNK